MQQQVELEGLGRKDKEWLKSLGVDFGEENEKEEVKEEPEKTHEEKVADLLAAKYPTQPQFDNVHIETPYPTLEDVINEENKKTTNNKTDIDLD